MPSSLNVLPLKVLFCSKVFMKILWIDQSRWNIDLSVYGKIFNLLKMQWFAKNVYVSIQTVLVKNVPDQKFLENKQT